MRELDLSDNDDDTLLAARRAGLAGRRAAGHDDGGPDVLFGPALSPEARVRVSNSQDLWMKIF